MESIVASDTALDIPTESKGTADVTGVPKSLDVPPQDEDARGEENKFQTAISIWRSVFDKLLGSKVMLTVDLADIDLTKLVPELDSVATDIVAHQRDSVVSRKDLAQKTKNFRKLDDGTKLIEIKTLLKGGFTKRESWGLLAMLRPAFSLPNVHRHLDQSWQIFLLCVPSSLLFYLGGS